MVSESKTLPSSSVRVFVKLCSRITIARIRISREGKPDVIRNFLSFCETRPHGGFYEESATPPSMIDLFRDRALKFDARLHFHYVAPVGTIYLPRCTRARFGIFLTCEGCPRNSPAIVCLREDVKCTVHVSDTGDDRATYFKFACRLRLKR
jgi:hypothetical protein